ncbi:cytochrome P450 [Flavimarina sp. Hel_I_48]|uniref:cytochrome P450 n=1 Tax=Flavimarina sp. Hel_I_48 TaxID=1392488 RepID=UPI0004DEF073|nr:cytochrome P450 [Flavimarina sp. Hel_I_48]
MAKFTEIPQVSTFRFVRHANEILNKPLPFHAENFKRHGDTFQLNLGFGQSVVFSRDAGFVQHALQKNQKNYSKSPIQTKDVAKYVGEGLLTAEGEHWRRQRKMIQPAFHKKQLYTLLGRIQEAINTELNRIKTGEKIDIFPVFNDLAFQTVVKSLFSSAVGVEEINRLQHITETTQKMLVRELRQPFKGWWFKLSGQIKEHTDLTDEARDILIKLVQERRKSKQREDDLLDMLLEARYEDGSAMSERQLIDEILILFTAGHETTSNALTFTAQLLAQHQDIQEQVYEEICQIRSKTTDLLSFLKGLIYTKQVVEESLRLYPPAYFIDRMNREEDIYNGMRIPAQSRLLFSIQEIHRHTAHWEAPDTFDPSRFDDGNSLKYSSFYYPFGAGPRMCIGNNFAMYEMILAVAELIATFKIFKKKTPIEILPLITLKPKNAFLEFEKR